MFFPTSEIDNREFQMVRKLFFLVLVVPSLSSAELFLHDDYVVKDNAKIQNEEVKNDRVGRFAKTDITELSSTIKPLPRWTLTAGHAIGQELKTWGAKSGWNVIWNLPRDLIVPSTTEFVGEFTTAAAEVIKTLAANGALIHAKFYEGNKTMVINGPGVVPQN